MNSNKEETENKLKQLEIELEHLLPIMSQAVETILDQEITKYPILIVHRDTIDMGVPFLQREEGVSKWSVNASSLEEFVTKRLILEERLDDFKKVYKNPIGHLCLFVLSDLGASFIFMPRID